MITRLVSTRYVFVQSGHWSQPQPVHALRIVAR